MTNDKKERYTFDPMEIGVLIAEARECIKVFIPAIKSDLAAQPYDVVLKGITEVFEEWDPIDVPSFRYGMYALATELERQRILKEKRSAGVRFIV